MSLRNIIAPRQQVGNSQGVPLAGGQVFLYEPGTTTFITSYRDSALSIPHTSSQAIRLSGSGRANIWISRDCDLRILDKNNRLVLEELNANPDALGAEEAGGLVPNGSFEIDTDADMVPDGYTLVSEAGAVNGLDTSESTDGAQSFRFTSSGVGGGSLTATDFFPVNDVDNLQVNVDLRSTLATVRNIVRVEWYDISQVSISNSDPYDSTANPLTFTEQQLSVVPPVNARFAKVRLIGIDPSVALAGSTYFDRLNVFYPVIVSGVFDNITIQNNEVISTNLNGDVNLTPNGTGRTVATRLSAPDTIRVRTDIITATPPVAEAVVGHYDIYDLDETDPLMQLGYFGANELALVNRMHGGAISLLGEDAGGTQRTLLLADPDNATNLFAAGVLRLIADATGVVKILSDDNVDTSIRRLDFQHQDGTLRALIGHNGGISLDIQNRINGGAVSITGRDGGGVTRSLIDSDPDGLTNLYNAGVLRLQVLGSGAVSVISDASTDAEQRILQFTHQNLTRRGFVGHLINTAMQVRNEVHGGSVTIQAENAGGTLVTGFTLLPDTLASLDHPGANESAVQSADRTASDITTSAQVRHSDTVLYDIGMNLLPASVRDAAYTFLKSDVGKNIRHTDGTARQYDCDPDTTIPAGSAWLVTTRGAGTTTLFAGTGVSIDYIDSAGVWQTVTPSGTVAAGAGEFLLKKLSDTLYEAIGSGFP